MSRFTVFAALLFAAGCRKDIGDADGDGFEDDDCAPYDAASGPGLAEVCDGRDNDCDGTVDEEVGATYFTDGDGDGFGDDATSHVACAPVGGDALIGGDCDDASAQAHPGAAEACDGTDDTNCDGSAGSADADDDGVVACNDCDDLEADVHPGADETCNDVDDDCDGTTDEDATDAETYYLDLDDDGHGSERLTQAGCEAPSGFVAADDDCDDLHASSFPGAPEDCDGMDNDCDGTIDDGASGTVEYFADTDQDGYGDATSSVDACARPAGYVDNDDDCNDADDKFNPAASESCSDPTDYNCDGAVGQADGDGDGAQACNDCDDTDADVKPGAPEVCDGVDNDCNGDVDETAPTWYADVDGDGRGGDKMSVAQCAQPAGFVSSDDDCNDLDGTVAPGATEACDGQDNDCDGSTGLGETDTDGDRFLACDGDCDDTDASAHPGGVEVCDGKDQDCDSTADDGAVDGQRRYTDADADGFGTGTGTVSCATAGALVAGDCDDSKSAVKPGATEACNTFDDDCDGAVDESGSTGSTTYYADADGDTFGNSKASTSACAAPAGYVASSTDCNDGNAAIRPGATEACNGLDDDCNAAVPANEADGDADGFRSCAGDCNDGNKAISPVGIEVCNTVDDNCVGGADENAVDRQLYFRDADNDKFGTSGTTQLSCSAANGYVLVAGDCNDGAAAISPVAPELCSTVSVDDDCDGASDEADAQDAKNWYQDADADAHGTPGNFTRACAAPSGRVALADDCNDANNKVYGGATEVWYNGTDENCDGKSDYDQDYDGYLSTVAGGSDCDDTKTGLFACGGSKTAAMESCQELLETGVKVSGYYWVDPDGDGDTTDAFSAYCHMTLAGGGWTRVYYQDSSAGFFVANEFEKNKATPSATLYAVLNDVEAMRKNGGFEFLMRWPGNATYPEYHHWWQTNNPVTDAAGALPTGYVSIYTPYQANNGWGGLQRAAAANTSLIDGTITPLTNWYYAVGTMYCWGGAGACQPAPNGGTNIVELYVR